MLLKPGDMFPVLILLWYFVHAQHIGHMGTHDFSLLVLISLHLS